MFLFSEKPGRILNLLIYDKDQKAQVFKFLTEYAKEKSITLVNQDEPKQ